MKNFNFFQGRFTNPVYESMYAGTTEPVLLNSTNCNGNGTGSNGNNFASEEKKGLLQHNQDEINTQDLI